MRRICAFISVFVLLIAAGCQNEGGSKNEPVSPPSAYTANLDVTFGNAETTAKLIKHSAQKYEVQILSPEIMKPLNLIYENGKCTATYDGLTFETEIKRFPQSEFGGLLTQALTDIDGGVITSSTTDTGDIIYSGITNYGDFVLIQDAETGLWKEFSVDGASLKILFSDYTTN